MSKTDVTLTINVADEGDRPNSSSTVIQVDSLEELHRMLDLAGVPGAYQYGEPVDVEQNIEDSSALEVEEQETYKPSAENKVRNPDHKPNNPRFADNSLEERAEYIPGMQAEDIVDMYFNFLAVSDHDEAVARVADEVGMRGEDIAKMVAKHKNNFGGAVSEDFNDYNDVAATELPPLPKGFKDYLSDLGAERVIQHEDKRFKVKVEWMDSNYDTQFEEMVVTAGTAKEAEQSVISMLKVDHNNKVSIVDSEVEEYVGESEVDEAYGRPKDPRQKGYYKSFEHTLALLPCPGMFTVDQLGDNEYFGDNLKAGKSSIVVLSIDTGDKPRLTFASTYGGVSNYRPGQNVLTYHDQTGKERPGTIVLSFTGKEWSTPEGRAKIKSDMAKEGMDPKKKYSVRVFK